jgi:tripartite ATP-independent transporter DctP family solute receptor
MKKMSYIGILTVVSASLIVGVMLSGCGKGAAPATPASQPDNQQKTTAKVQPKKMRIALTLSDQSNEYRGLFKFKELVEKYTNGSITPEIYPSGQLGADMSAIQQLQSGVLEATGPTSAPVANVVPEFNLFDLPFLFKDQKSAESVLSGKIGQALLDKLPEKGLIGLAYWDNGFRELTNSKHPVKSVEDLKGIKLRVLQNPVHVDFWKALGTNPTPMSWDQVFNALQQHVIDGQENPLGIIYDQKVYEVQKYLTLTNHVYQPILFMASKIWYDGLTKEEQQALMKAAKEAGQYELQLNQQEQESLMNALKQKGMQIDSISDDVRKQMIQTVQPVVNQYVSKYGDLGKQFMEAVNKVNAQ